MRKIFSAALALVCVWFATPALAALPTGYTELEYIESTGTQYLDLDTGTQTGVFKIIADVYAAGSTDWQYLFGYAKDGGGSPLGVWVSKNQIKETFAAGNGNVIADVNKWEHIDITNSNTVTIPDFYIFHVNPTGITSYTINPGRIKYLQLKKDGDTIRNMVSARRKSDNVLGMYDTVTGNFFTNAGTGEFIAGDPVAQTPTNSGPISSVTVAGLVAQNGTPSPNTPVAINTNNGVLKASKNLINANSMVVGKAVATSGAETTQGTVQRTAFIPVSPNTTYTWSGLGVISSILGKRGGEYSSADFSGFVQSINDSGSSGTFTTSANTHFVVLNAWKGQTEMQLEAGSTATPYKPYGEIYTDGEVETIADSANHTATVATLLGVGDYRDTQNINTGAITRNVGVKVLDGTENWAQRVGNIFETGVSPEALSPVGTGSLSNQYTFFSGAWADIPNNGFRIAGTQLRIRNDTTTSTEQLKQYLADQYAAGTPVTIVYPLATPTTESVAGQTMTTAPVNNRTGGVSGMTITTLLSSGASVVTTIATNAIKIATTKYNESAFGPLNTALANAISVVDTVVSNTITQAGRIATLQAQKQTRPNDIADDNEKCPAGKKCLLVEDASGVPHWYEIVTSILPDGYTELQYIESTGTQYIDTGVVSSREAKFGIKFRDTLVQDGTGFFGSSSWANSLSFYSTTIRYCLNNTAFSLNITYATHSGELICSSAGVVGTLDGREVSFPQVTDSNGGSGNIYLFSGGRNRSGIEAKIDWFKIWDLSGTLVRNFVPAKNPDGKIGMYDLVGERFYENAGTGEFIAGPVAE